VTVEFVGPFRHWDVIVNGHAVPFLTATPRDNGDVSIQIDRRFGIDLTAAEAEDVVPFLAEAIAVALGFTCHPCPDFPEPPLRKAAVRVHPLGWGKFG
jgi:hypothetical protein